MLKKIVLVFAALALAEAQIPSLGWCPDYVPMPGFDIERFLGIWHEAERYFQITEVVSRCVTSNYTRGPDGKLRVYNEVINRFTGVKRTVEGEIKPAASKADQGKLHVKYTTIPLAPETDYTVLETDYTSYAVLWGCSGIGPFHAQNAWLLTREINPSGETLQAAYGVLDKHKIWKRLFVKSDQVDCSYEAPTPAPAVAVTTAPAAAPAAVPAAVPASVPVKEEPVVPDSVPAVKKSFEGIHLRSSSALLQDPEPIDESRKETIESEAAEKLPEPSPASEEQPAIENLRLAKPELPEAPADEIKPQQVPVQAPIAPETIPEVILKVAESSKESSEPVAPSLPVEDAIPEKLKTEEVAVLPESQPEVFPEAKPSEEVAEPVPVVKKTEIDEVAVLPESDEKLAQKGADSVLAGEESKIEEVAVLPEAKPLKEEKLEAAVEETKVSELAQDPQPEVVIPAAAEPPNKAEEKPEVAAPEEPKASESAPESIPEEKPALVDSAPAEEPLPIVAAPEEPKPLDALPSLKSPEPATSILLEDAVEKKDEKTPQASEVAGIETPAAFGQVKNEEIIPAEKIPETKFVQP